MNKNRIASIDALRGFSLLGILIVNMMHFQYASEQINVISSYAYFNEITYFAVRILLQGSFLTIFAFLFGFSIMQFYYARNRKQLSYKFPLFKRGLALFIIGLLHYIFIWTGDILASYGIMIMFTLLFVHTTPKVLKILMFVLFPIYFIINLFARLGTESGLNISTELRNNIIYSTANYTEVLNHRLMFGQSDIFLSPVVNFIVHLINTSFVPLILIPFAIYGMYVSKLQLSNIKKFEAVSIKIWLPITVLGIGLKCSLLLGNTLGISLFTLGSILTTYGYIHMFLSLYNKGLPDKIKLVFESVGKMTISNYLAQSIILTLLFASYGLGLSGKVGLTWGIVMALALFVIQAATSHFIIKRFKQGPVEYVLRKFLYSGDKRAEKKKNSVTIEG